MTNDRLPPHDIDAEEAVIGSLLIGGEINACILEGIDFYHEPLSIAYQCCLDLSARKTSIDQITLAQELERKGDLEFIGGVAYLSHLIAITPTSLDLVHYAEIVRRLSVCRKMIATGLKIEQIGYDALPDVVASLEMADIMIRDLRKQHGEVDLLTPMDRAELMGERYMRLGQEADSIYLPTGLLDLDRYLGGGFFPGDLVVLGGDAGLGKSTLAQNIANNQTQYGNVLFCSGEMTVEGLTDREIASMVGKNVVSIMAGHYDEELERGIMESLGVISERPIYYYRRNPLTCGGIRSAATQMELRHGGVRCIVVDYLQKVMVRNSRESRYIQLGEVTNELANIAKELKTTVLLLVQLKNKDIEYRLDKRPHLGDIYESGRIEQDADVVLLLYRADKYYTREQWQSMESEKEFPEGIAEIILAKQRQGGRRPKIIEVVWDETHSLYRDLARDTR